MSTIIKLQINSSNTLRKIINRNGIFSLINRQSVCFVSTDKSKRVLNLMKQDGIPDHFDLVYRNPATRYVQITQAFSSTTGVGFSTALLYSIMNDVLFIQEGYGPTSYLQLGVASSILLSTCLVLQFICYKSPIRIYSDAKKFVIIAYGPLGMLTPRKIEFNGGTCKRVRLSFPTFLRDCTFKINGKLYFIFEDHFKSNADYNRMIGL